MKFPNRIWQLAVLTSSAGLFAVTCASGPAAASSLARSVASAHQVTMSRARLELSRLSALHNYTFTSVATSGVYSLALAGRVHSPSDWEVHSTSPAVTTYDVGGRGYGVALGQVIHITFNTPEGLTHLSGEQTYAEALVGYTHVTGIKITTAGRCTVAGTPGTTYHVQSPDASMLSEVAAACVDNSSGALLSYTSGINGGSAAKATHLTGLATKFTVVSIGGVGQIYAPRPRVTKPVPTVPSYAGVPTGMPSGFPREVPAPPGKIISAVRLSAGKWYLELTEKSATAIVGYTRSMKARGFRLTSSTDTAASDIEVLANGPVQVLLEQMSLPGQGVVLAVSVTRSS